MKFLFVLASVLLFISYVNCDCEQISGTTWECTGGTGQYPLQYFSFDDDEDFSLYLKYSDCTVFQDGGYDINNGVVSVDLSGILDNCESTETNDQCDCYEDFDMQIDSQCLVIVGPNGENCVPQGDCAKQTCTDGSTPIQDPNYVPSTNECGPSSIPIGAPEFAFADCCDSHDTCYPTCGKEKRDCDYEFYSCMACACESEYDNAVSEELCLLIACLYFQAVDEFGCGSYETSQDSACICPNNKGIEAPREYKPVPDKFGNTRHIHEIVSLYQKGTLGLADFICDAPFDATCDSMNQSNTSVNTSNNNSSNGSGSVTLVASIVAIVIACLALI